MKTYFKATVITLSLLLFTINVKAVVPHIDINRTRQKVKQTLAFCKHNGYNTNYCILIDMSLPSGLKRFVIWDFHKNDTLLSGLVSHGCGKAPWSGVWSKDKPVFSNVTNAHCTSLGKYEVGARAYSAWGIHIKYYLKGLESTNNNAFVRDVVFHSWEQVPDTEVYPTGTPEDWGCPAVSNNTMKIADSLIRKQKKHLLLWIYN